MSGVYCCRRKRRAQLAPAPASRPRHFRQSEVENLGLSTFGEKQIRGLQIAMDDARRVSHIQRVGNLRPKIHQLVDRDWLALDAVLERRAIEILHHDVLAALVFSNVVDGADIGMVECGRRPRLAPEPLQCLRILRQFVRQKLQRDAAPQAQVFRLIDNTHAAAAQFLRDAVVRYGFSNHLEVSDMAGNVRLPTLASQFSMVFVVWLK